MGTKPKYEPNWESLRNYQVPDWFRDAKLGIFIHWGVYAVPAFENEWYPRNMYLEGSPAFEHHRKAWGDQKEFGYKDFIPKFRAEKWDPEGWVDLFKRAGARYVVPVAEHHDGFPMYDCPFTNFNAARMGPRRDVVAELEEAVRRAGLKFGVSSHRAHNWRFYTFRDAFDTSDSDNRGLYGTPHPDEAPVSYEFVLDWYARTRDLVDRFSPDVLWFDFGWHRDEFEPWRARLAAYYYNHALVHERSALTACGRPVLQAAEIGGGGRRPEPLVTEPVLQYKDKVPADVAVFDVERGKLDDVREHCWQTDTSVSYRSWCYIEDDEFRTVASVVHDLVDIVSKNGCLLLNIGPRADGTIPDEVVALLEGLGSWLRTNGEAVYGTRPWRTFGEGETGAPKSFKEREQKPYAATDVRFTVKGSTLYATCLGWPGERAVIETLRSGGPLPAEAIARVTMLGAEGDCAFSQDGEGLTVRTPADRPCEHAFTFRIETKGGL